ncbi:MULTISPECIES: hypothetical protein [Fischerella]|uniref:hypothetical protein n=1 Tax=Fischerella TaxID=1190 RepID=UPI0011AFA28E|nr:MULTISPECIES: hypothetical protein [Fischerella]
MKYAFVSAMPKCFESWCGRFDEFSSRQTQDQAFRPYLGRVLAESQRTDYSPKKTCLDKILQL